MNKKANLESPEDAKNYIDYTKDHLFFMLF